MKKILMFFLALTLTTAGMTAQTAIKKRASRMVMKKTHLLITFPTQNHVYYLPEAVKIKVKLVRPARVLFHVWDLTRGGVKKKTLEENKLRKSRKDGSYRGAVTFALRAGRYHVIAAPQTNLGKDSNPAGPIKFMVRLKLKSIPLKKRT